MPNPYILLGAGLLTLALMFTAYRHGVSTTETRYQLVIEQRRADSERAVREAEKRGQEYARKQREQLTAAAEKAIADKSADVARANKVVKSLARELAEVNRADVSADAWGRATVPRALADPVERVYPPSGEAGSGGGGAISLPPDPSGTAGSL